jgi:hypothetical protein
VAIEQLTEYVERLRAFNPEQDILQRQRLGTDAALRIDAEASALVAAFQAFADQDYRSLPGPILDRIEGVAQATLQDVEKAQSLTPERASQERDNLENRIRTRLTEVIQELFPAEAMMTARRALAQAESADLGQRSAERRSSRRESLAWRPPSRLRPRSWA